MNPHLNKIRKLLKKCRFMWLLPGPPVFAREANEGCPPKPSAKAGSIHQTLACHSLLLALVERRLEIDIADKRRRIAEGKNLGGPEPAESVLPIDPVEQIGKAGP